MHSDLNELRRQLDIINEEFMTVLARRFVVTDAVGEFKKAHGLPGIDLAREEQQLQKLGELAAAHGLNQDLVAAIFRLILMEVRRNHAEKGVS